MNARTPSAYEAAGVSIDRGNASVAAIQNAVASTHNAQVLASLGAFGGAFALNDLPENPVLVASTDGVGTKVKLAADLGRLEGIGQDIVNHCINDIACAGQNVRPLFFLDYVASARLEPALLEALVSSMAEACRAANCALLGGESAEMPGVYQDEAFDVVGTVVGVMDDSSARPKDL